MSTICNGNHSLDDQAAIEQLAYYAWRQRFFSFNETDEALQSYLDIKETGPTLRQAREAQLQTIKSAAKNMRVSPATFGEFEARAQNETISIQKLKEAAEAIGCELVYAIRPKSKLSFSQIMWNKLLPFIQKDKSIEPLKGYYKANAMAVIANMLINDAEFRRAQGWSRIGNLNECLTLRTIDRRRVRRLLENI